MDKSSKDDPVLARVRALMAENRVSQGRLGRRLGISQAAVSRRLSGESPFSVAELAGVADVLGVSLAEIVGS